MEPTIAGEMTILAPWRGPAIVEREGAETLSEWARAHHDWLDATLLAHGAVLFRRFAVDSVAAFREVSQVLCRDLLEYTYRSTPRTAVEQSVYTATEYPAEAVIPMHCENAYQRDWPMRLVFGCTQPAASGGETPLALVSNVTRRVEPAIIRLFAERRVQYVRNYGHGLDLPWQTTFQTTSRDEVESFCRREDIEWEWLPDDRLRTKQVCQGVACHPRTREELWFNQAHLFHVSALGPEDAAAMLDLFDESDLPRHAYFGDGSRIDVSLLDCIRRAYDAELHVFQWERGDVLLVDNMLVAHGRKPFTGKRQVLVAMGDACRTYASTAAVSPSRVR